MGRFTSSLTTRPQERQAGTVQLVYVEEVNKHDY